MNINNLENIIKSGNPIIWIDTKEYERCIDIIDNISRELNKGLYIWDIADNIVDINREFIEDDNPVSFLKEREESILILKDYHNFLKETKQWRELANIINSNIENGNTAIIISPIVEIPSEIEHYITVLDMQLPSQEYFLELLNKIIENENYNGRIFDIDESQKNIIANSGLGLTEYEFKNAIYLSIEENNDISKKFIFEQKKQIVEKNGTIKVYDSKEGLDSLIGMENMKNFTKSMVMSGQGRGILIVGVPGGGKTEFAKRLGKDTNRLTVSVDFGELMGSYVGETERKTKEAFKVIDSVSPSIVFIDEIEKGLSGTNSEGGDSVSQRQGGQFLKWMQDHESDAYIVATANNIYTLPPEFLRSGRWDAIFFVDMPSSENKRKILELYKDIYKINDDIKIENMDFTGAEIETLCRLSKNLNISLIDAREYVCPISVTMREQISKLRKYVENRVINADNIKNNKKDKNRI